MNTERSDEFIKSWEKRLILLKNSELHLREGLPDIARLVAQVDSGVPAVSDVGAGSSNGRLTEGAAA